MIPLLWMLACATPAPSEVPSMAAPEPDPAPEQPTTDSLYSMKLELTDPDGQPMGLDQYRGHPTLVSMFYTHCSQACPMLIARIQSVEARLSPEERANLRVLLISMDPTRDTPDQLRASLESHHVDRSRWTFARPRPDDVRMIAALLGLRYRELPDGSFSHSSVISLLDPSGEPVARMEGLASDDAALIAAIRQ